jgi:hypothetical protein
MLVFLFFHQKNDSSASRRCTVQGVKLLIMINDQHQSINQSVIKSIGKRALYNTRIVINKRQHTDHKQTNTKSVALALALAFTQHNTTIQYKPKGIFVAH